MSALQTQIRREFWEHRALWIAPLAIAMVLLLATSIFGHIRIDVGDAQQLQDGHPAPLVLFQGMLFGWALPFYLAALILVAAYLIDCLYGERRDRSILFWRSMPVSDARTVLVKLLVGLGLVPLGTFVLAALTSLAASAILAMRNHGPVVNGLHLQLWDMLSWLQIQGIMLYGLLAALLWYAPFAAYLMLVSVWARRSPYAWAFLPPLLLVIFEHLVFGTNYIGSVVNGGFGQLLHLAYRLDDQLVFNMGTMPSANGAAQVPLSAQLLDPLRLLASARLWCGLLAATLMIGLAIRLRRLRDDS